MLKNKSRSSSCKTGVHTTHPPTHPHTHPGKVALFSHKPHSKDELCWAAARLLFCSGLDRALKPF